MRAARRKPGEVFCHYRYSNSREVGRYGGNWYGSYQDTYDCVRRTLVFTCLVFCFCVMLDSLINFVQNNLFLVIVILFFLYQKYQASRPWPDYGGEITSIHSAKEWEEILANADKGKQVVVIDCYATWCPPCKKCAPTYAKMR